MSYKRKPAGSTRTSDLKVDIPGSSSAYKYSASTISGLGGGFGNLTSEANKQIQIDDDLGITSHNEIVPTEQELRGGIADAKSRVATLDEVLEKLKQKVFLIDK